MTIPLNISPAELGKHDAEAGLPCRAFLFDRCDPAQMAAYEAAWHLAYAEKVIPGDPDLWSAL